MTQESNNQQKEGSVKLMLLEWAQTLERFIVSKKHTRFIITLAILGSLATVAVGVQTLQQEMTSSGTIRVIGVNVFSDKACTKEATSLTWGIIDPGASADNYVYVRNDGTTSGTLSMTYSNWSPAAAASYLTLTWNCSNYVIPRDAVVCAKLTLTVKSTITGVKDFSFATTIQSVG
jgi:hypothetical protein